MQTHIYDQFEFDSAVSENTLHVVIAQKAEHPSAQSFFDNSAHERFRYGIYNNEKRNYRKSPALKRDRRRKQRKLANSPTIQLQPIAMAEYIHAKQLREHVDRFNCFPEPIENFTVIASLHHTPPFVPLKLELLLESEKHYVWYHYYSTA